MEPEVAVNGKGMKTHVAVENGIIYSIISNNSYRNIMRFMCKLCTFKRYMLTKEHIVIMTNAQMSEFAASLNELILDRESPFRALLNDELTG